MRTGQVHTPRQDNDFDPFAWAEWKLRQMQFTILGGQRFLFDMLACGASLFAMTFTQVIPRQYTIREALVQTATLR